MTGNGFKQLRDEDEDGMALGRKDGKVGSYSPKYLESVEKNQHFKESSMLII